MWKMVSAVGYGVLFSLALTGAVRISCLLRGTTLPDDVAGNIFMISSVVTGALSAFLYSRFLKQAQPKA
jgi:hypothetical protein